MRVGKVIAISVGGGIILLQIANEKGYININWNKVNNKIDKVTDKVEQQLTGEGPSWFDKVISGCFQKICYIKHFIVRRLSGL